MDPAHGPVSLPLDDVDLNKKRYDINMQFRNGNLIRQPEYLAKSLNPIIVDNAIRGNPGQEISNMDCGSVKDFAPLTGPLCKPS